MQNTKDLVLGIDTSNYTTSVALTDSRRNVIKDERILLSVKQGERGLRQSNALFQHQENLPNLLHRILPEYRERIGAISVSSRPRPVDGSYMPVFLAGCQTGKILADAFGVPYFEFSHQEGHLKAASFTTTLDWKRPYLAWHLSGGTCELLSVTPGNDDQESPTIDIIGGSLDISFGQLLDRLGVAMDLQFPCGKALDTMALAARDHWKEELAEIKEPLFKSIARKGLNFNLSGLETQVLRLYESDTVSPEILVYALFEEICRCLSKVTVKAVEETKMDQVLFTGGVSASRYMRERWDDLMKKNRKTKFCTVFGDIVHSSDNAVGTSILGGECLWD
ncbi:MAG: hypothetical protein II983_04320 [Firmicutes bacterium]|nr:hypothetical protein [Bacillota bacterium]MBQ6685336.1 hypothetical protein [Bacillota bacterium]